MTKNDSEGLKRFLASELDRLVEEFRDIELSGEKLDDYYEVIIRDELARDDRVYNFIVALTYQKKCSLVVATAAVYVFGRLYPGEDFLLPERPKN